MLRKGGYSIIITKGNYYSLCETLTITHTPMYICNHRYDKTASKEIMILPFRATSLVSTPRGVQACKSNSFLSILSARYS